MKLISMTDFVISQWDKDITSEEFAQSMINYATFLKQPLKLEMFVLCDEDGNVLHEPKAEDYFNTKVPTNELTKEDADGLNRHYADLLMFEEAKEKVLFEGFKIESDALILPNGSRQMISYFNALVIEDLAHFNPILTPTAINQIRS